MQIDGMLFYATGEESEWFARVAPAIWTYPDGDQGPYRDGYGFDVRGGWQGPTGDRSKISAELGLAWWFFDETFGDINDYGDDDVVVLVGGVGLGLGIGIAMVRQSLVRLFRRIVQTRRGRRACK